MLGSGSNLLVADEGVPGLVIKLDRELAAISVEARRMLCGGGARLPAVAARAGPRGPVGDRVRRQHPRHGRRRGADERQRLRRRAGAGARVGRDRQPPAARAPRARSELGFAYRRSSLARGRGRRRRVAAAAPRPRSRGQGARSREMRRRRHEAQPQGIRTFGSTFKNPDDPRAQGRSAGLLLAEAGCNGLAVGGARFAPKHANFIENTGSAHDRRRGRADGRGAPARARALRRGARARGADARRRALPLER